MTNASLARASGWHRFWFLPQPTSTLAVFRIALGLIATGWTLSLAPDLLVYFGPAGVLPNYPQPTPGAWGVLAVSSSPPVVIGLLLLTLVGSLALTVGLHTRIAALVVFLGMLSFHRRNPLLLNSGDVLMLNLALFCALAPAGVALSVDRWRRAREHFWEFPARSPWPLRLVQIQLSVLYLSAVWQKMQGERWRDGTAVSYALRIEDIHRFATPAYLTDSVVLTEFLTFGTLAVELALGLLVWNRALRPWVLGAGAVLHLTIDSSILVGFFSFAILTAYLAFVPPDTASRLILRLRDRLGRGPGSRSVPSTAEGSASERASELGAAPVGTGDRQERDPL